VHWLALLAFAATGLIAPAAASADTWNVTTTADSAPGSQLVQGSLRWALSKASDGDTIVLLVSRIVLQGQLPFNHSVTIQGKAPVQTEVDGNGKGRVFFAEGGGDLNEDRQR
jgi:hypothetical protein